MIVGGVNLARRPFVNRRPVLRLGLLLWFVGLLVLGGNVWLYWGYLRGAESTAAELERVETQIGAEKTATSARETDLRGLSLATRNEQVSLLNNKIAARTFAWSRLFDDLAEVLPRRVRLYELTPQLPRREAGRSGGRTVALKDLTAGTVHLHLRGAAESDEALVELLEHLFAHPAFGHPDILSESRPDLRLIEFEINVDYDPNTDHRPKVPATGPAPLAPSVSGSSQLATGSLVPRRR